MLHVALDPVELFRSQRAQTAGLQVADVYESHEMDSTVVEAVPPAALPPLLRPLAVAVQVARTAIYSNIMFSRNVEGFPGASFPEYLIGGIKLGRLGQLSDVAGVQQKRGLRGQCIDLGDCRPKCRSHIAVRGLVEADVAIAYLHKEKLSFSGRFSTQACGARDPSVYRPQQSCSDPGHAAEEIASVEAVRIDGIVRYLVIRGHVHARVSMLGDGARIVGNGWHCGFVSRKVMVL